MFLKTAPTFSAALELIAYDHDRLSHLWFCT